MRTFLTDKTFLRGWRPFRLNKSVLKIREEIVSFYTFEEFFTESIVFLVEYSYYTVFLLSCHIQTLGIRLASYQSWRLPIDSTSHEALFTPGRVKF